MNTFEFYACIDASGRSQLIKNKIYQVMTDDALDIYILVENKMYFKRRFKKLQQVYRGV